jgi:hypothetical protein
MAFSDMDFGKIGVYAVHPCSPAGAKSANDSRDVLGLRIYSNLKKPEAKESSGGEFGYIWMQYEGKHQGDLKLLADAIYTLAAAAQKQPAKCLFVEASAAGGTKDSGPRSAPGRDTPWSSFLSGYEGADATVRYRLSTASGTSNRQAVEFFVTNESEAPSTVAFKATMASKTGESTALDLASTDMMKPGAMSAVSRVPFGDNDCITALSVSAVEVCAGGGTEDCHAADTAKESAGKDATDHGDSRQAAQGHFLSPPPGAKPVPADLTADAGGPGNADLHEAAGAAVGTAASSAPDEDPRLLAAGPARDSPVRKASLSVSDPGQAAKEINFTRRDGGSYHGSAVNGVPEGKGTMTTAGGDRYEGSFAKGVLSGVGSYSWSDGANYTGLFAQGAPNGLGTFKYTDGTIYTGEVKDGAPDGKGSLTRADGSTLTGNWAAGRFQHP